MAGNFAPDRHNRYGVRSSTPPLNKYVLNVQEPCTVTTETTNRIFQNQFLRMKTDNQRVRTYRE